MTVSQQDNRIALYNLGRTQGGIDGFIAPDIAKIRLNNNNNYYIRLMAFFPGQPG